MSEVMLHGVLNMPPELWNNDSPIDVAQRHSRYIEASKRIYELEEQLQQANEYADRLVEHKDMVCLPADLTNLREANAQFAIENETLKKQLVILTDALQACRDDLESELLQRLPSPAQTWCSLKDADKIFAERVMSENASMITPNQQLQNGHQIFVAKMEVLMEERTREIRKASVELMKELKHLRSELNTVTQQRAELVEALRKAILWGESASHHILYRQNINWTYLNEARKVFESFESDSDE